MHPAFSVIFFTTASGAGYGLLALLGLLAPLGLLPAGRWFGFAGLALALGLITFGLLSSTFHLGHPERAWRALSQWRSSWLSREGIVAVATYLPAGLFGIGWVFLERVDGVFAIAGVLSALGAVATVGCTAMIYASLKPVPQWRSRWVLPGYLAFAAMTGALLLVALAGPFGATVPWLGYLAVAAVLVGLAVKLAYWRAIDGAAAVSTAESATGLGRLGGVHLLDPPNTEENYLMREMGYRVARKYAARLRRLALLFGFVAPALLIVMSIGTGAWPAGLLAALSAGLGMVIERWLFFAEARHTVQLYYGAREV